MKKIIILIFGMILLMPIVSANWLNVQSDSQNIHNLLNASGSSSFFYHPSSLYSESLWYNSATLVGLANKSDDWNFQANENKTIEFWLFYNSSTAGETNQKILGFNASNTGVDRMSFRFHNNLFNGAFNLRLEGFAGLATDDYNLGRTTGINDSSWHHIALTWYNTSANGSNFKFLRVFIDGVVNTTIATRGNQSDIGHLFIGKAASFGIDELRISNVSRYLLNFTVPSTAFTLDSNTEALYHFDDPDIPNSEIAQCSEPLFYQSVAVNYTFYDEVNLTSFNITKFTASYTGLEVENTSNVLKLNLTIDNKPSNVALCITPKTSTYRINSSIKVEKDGFNFRNDYFDSRLNNLTSTTELRKLYLLRNAEATLITIEVTDSIDTALQDILTHVQRFYIANDTWTTIGMIKSGEDGKDTIYLQQNEVDYRFLLYQDGKLVKTTTGQKITASTYKIKIIPTSLSNLISDIKDITTNLTFTNETRTFNYGFNDPNSKMAGACLQVSISNTSGTYFETTSCQYGSFIGIISVEVGNSSPSTAMGYGYVIMNGSILNFGKQTLQVVQGLTNNLSTWGKYGIYLLFMLLVGFVMVFIGNPVSVILALMVGIFFAWWMDIFTLSTLAFTGLMIGLGVLIKELRS